MKILSSFTHPQVVANLYEFLSSRLEPNSCLTPLTFIVEKTKNTMEVKGAKVRLPHLPLCSAEEINLYRFATT